MASTSSSLVSALGAGSGVDIRTLAENLVTAERAPKEELLQARIDKSSARISGYSAIRYSLGTISDAFAELKDQTDYAAFQTDVSDSSSVAVTTTSTASEGSYSLNIQNLAAAQVSRSGYYTSASDSINGGVGFSLEFTPSSGTATSISVSTATPQGIADAINAATDANGDALGVQASVMNTGSNGYTIVLTGETGLDQAFTMTADSGSGVDFSTTVSSAADAEFSLNGLSLTRSTNSVSDVLTGVTLDLTGATGEDIQVKVVRDATDLKTKIQNLVTVYNDALDALDILGDRSSEVEEYGGALAGESFLITLRSNLQSFITDTSSTAGSTIQAPRDVGLSFDRYGVLQFDETTFDDAVASNYDEIVTMFSANTTDQSVYDKSSGGVAGDAYREIDELIRFSGIIGRREKTQDASVERYQEQLDNYATQMDALLARYIQQFSVMDAIVNQTKSLSSDLASTFDGLMNVYKK